MPARKPKKSRKRKHEEIQQNSEDELSISPQQNPKRRKISTKSPKKTYKNKKKSPKSKSSKPKPKPKSDNDSENEHQPTIRKSSRLKKTQTKKNINSKKEIDNSSSESDSSDTSHTQNKNKKNKNKKKHKPLQKQRRISISQSQLSQSQSQSQRRRRQHTQSQSQIQSDDEFKIIEHNERVMEMYKWLTSSQSWSSIKNTLQTWVELESDSQDTENYSQLTVDIINLILYCGGVRVFKLQDIEDCDIESLTTKEKKKFVAKLQRALVIDHEDIESLPEEEESSDEEDNDNEIDHHSEDEKAEEADANTNNKNKNKNNKNKNNKKKKRKKKNKRDNKPRTTAEKILHYDAMLWTNGTMKDQKSFESRYRQLMEKIGSVFEMAIFDDDDYIITTILNWCSFFSRNFKYTQFRLLGTFTAFSICDPLVHCIAKNRKLMEKQRDIFDRELMNKNNKRGSNRKSKKKGESVKVKNLRENIEEYKTKINNLETHTNYVFERIAAYKASDSNEEIRCRVLKYIVKWINIDPSTDSFLRERYWQYLLYGLQDKQSEKVRIIALEQLMELFDYQHKFHGKPKRSGGRGKGNKGKNGRVMVSGYGDKLDDTRKVVLGPFWDRINATVHGLLKDKSENVVKCAIEFINVLLRGDMLGAEDGDCILNYIFDESDEIRQVSANFIFHDTFDDQAVLKAYESNVNKEKDEERDEEKQEDIKLRVKDVNKMKDDIVEIIQLMKDRVIDLNLRVNSLLNSEKQRVGDNGKLLKENALYRNYVQVSDYIVQSMSSKLPVLREWDVLFGVLRDADIVEERQKERGIVKEGGDGDGIQDMNIKHYIDDEGQTILCYLILSCIKMVRNKLDIECRNVKVKRGRKSKENELELRELALGKLKGCILGHLSKLLDIYQADVFKLYPLVKIIELVPIDTFNSVKSKEGLNEILKSLKIIFLRHDTPFIDYKWREDMESNSDGDSNMDELEVNDDMDSEEREEMEMKIRQKELKVLKKCIKGSIDNELVNEIGKGFTYLCNNEYQYKEFSGRFIFDIVSDIIDEFDVIYDKLDGELSKGNDMSTLDALMDDDNLGIIQSLYSNLHKQYSLKCGMDVGTISFNDNMLKLLDNVYDKLIFDGNKCEISSVLQSLLLIEIGHNVTSKLNRLSPDLEKLNELTQQKQCLVKILTYYVDIIYNNVLQNDNNNNNNGLEWSDILCILDRIVSMMDTLCFYRKLNNQSLLLDSTFNNASLIEMEPIQSVDNINDNNNNNNKIYVLKQRLLNICEYVFKLPIIEDPYDPSSHINTENIQIRYLLGCGRLCIMNCEYYKEFGSIIIGFYNRPGICNTRRNEIIRKILHRLCDNNHEKFEQMLFEGFKIIMNDESLITDDIDLRKDTIEKIAKSVSMFAGLSKKNRKYWVMFGKLLLNYIIGEIENIPKYFSYLHSLSIFFKTFTNRDKLEIWTYFLSLSRKLPSDDMRHENDKAKWVLYKQFRNKLKNEAQKAQINRSLNLNDNELENIDLENEQSQSQSQSQPQSQRNEQGPQDISMNIQVPTITDDDDNKQEANQYDNHNHNRNVDDNDNGNDSDNDDIGVERISVAKSSTRPRISVAKSREDRKEEEEVDNNDDDNDDNNDDNEEVRVVSHRVSVSKPVRMDNNENNNEDSDVDMKDKHNESDNESDNNSDNDKYENDDSQITTESSGKRGGLGRKRKVVSQQNTQRKSRSGKWLQRKG